MKCLQIAIFYIILGIVNGDGEESIYEEDEYQLAIASEEIKKSDEDTGVNIELVDILKENESKAISGKHQLAIHSKENKNTSEKNELGFLSRPSKDNISQSTDEEHQLTSKENERREESVNGTPQLVDVLKNSNRPNKRCDPRNKNSNEPNSCASSSAEKIRKKKDKILKRYTFKYFTTAKAPVLPRGPFFDFVVNICKTLLARFSKQKIPGYFFMLSRSLKNIKIEYSIKRVLDKFVKKLKRNSFFNGNVLKDKIRCFLKMISSGDPVINDFFYAMNGIYTSVDDLKFDDYIFRLKRYGEGDKKHIGVTTRKVIRWTIFHRLYHLDENPMNDIQIKFLSAVTDYMENKKKSLISKSNYICQQP